MSQIVSKRRASVFLEQHSQDTMSSQSRAIRPHSKKIVKFVIFVHLIFLIVRVRVIKRIFQTSIYYGKMDARFESIKDILRYLSPAQSLLKGYNTSLWRQREQTHMRLTGTDELN